MVRCNVILVSVDNELGNTVCKILYSYFVTSFVCHVELLGRDGWGSAFGSSYGGARGGGPMRGEYGSRDSGPYGGEFTHAFRILMCIRFMAFPFYLYLIVNFS